MPLSDAARAGRHPEQSVLRLPHERRRLPDVAGLDAREAAQATRALGQVRPVLRAVGTGGLPPRRAEGRSARPRCGSFRARYRSRSDRAARAELHEVANALDDPVRGLPEKLPSTERERECLHTRIEKLDLELSSNDGFGLPDQLIQPLLAHGAVTLSVDVESVRRAWRLTIDAHSESRGCSSHCRTHDEMKVAGMKAIGDSPWRRVQCGGLLVHRPVSRERPL